MSYGPNHVNLWAQAGTYVARILKGEKPFDLPVTQAALFEIVAMISRRPSRLASRCRRHAGAGRRSDRIAMGSDRTRPANELL